MNSGTSRARPARKSGLICSRSRSRSHSGSLDSTSVAPSLCPSTNLISAAAAVVIGAVACSPGRTSIDSRTMPMRRPPSAPGAPDFCACSAYEGSSEERGTVVNGSRGS